MNVTFDSAKRAQTLRDRGLDFVDVARVFNGPVFTRPDIRFDYPEPRSQTYGILDGRMVSFIWTPTDDGVRVISMRHCHDKEQRQYLSRLG